MWSRGMKGWKYRDVVWGYEGMETLWYGVVARVCRCGMRVWRQSMMEWRCVYSLLNVERKYGDTV